MSRPLGTADELERRRQRAVQAVADGQPRATVAAVLGVHPKTVARWVRLARQPGGLAAKPQPVRKVLQRRLGWTSQKPRRKARERDDREVSRWLADEVPRIVREALRRRAYLVFLDESGFYLTPTVR